MPPPSQSRTDAIACVSASVAAAATLTLSFHLPCLPTTNTTYHRHFQSSDLSSLIPHLSSSPSPSLIPSYDPSFHLPKATCPLPFPPSHSHPSCRIPPRPRTPRPSLPNSHSNRSPPCWKKTTSSRTFPLKVSHEPDRWFSPVMQKRELAPLPSQTAGKMK